MAGVRKKKTSAGKYVAFYQDESGRQKIVTGTRSKSETLAIAEKLEADARQVALGYKPAKTSAARHKTRPIAEAIGEYFDWGAAQGGRGGRPWSAEHSRKTRAEVEFWRQVLGLEALGDLAGCLPRVEAELRRLQAEGKAGKTLNNLAGSLHTFIGWLQKRGYLDGDPLAGLSVFNGEPVTTRRALKPDEIQKLLATVPDDRRLLYAVAIFSGLRAGELAALTPGDLDHERGGIRLRAEVTKNRKPGLQPLPSAVFRALADHAANLGAGDRIFSFYKNNASRVLKKDLRAAGIPEKAFGGKMDFHGLRVTFINLVLASGASVKESMALARHSSPNMTLNVYGRADAERLAGLVEGIGGNMENDPDKTQCRHKIAAGAESLLINNDLEQKDGGFNSPRSHFSITHHLASIYCAIMNEIKAHPVKAYSV